MMRKDFKWYLFVVTFFVTAAISLVFALVYAKEFSKANTAFNELYPGDYKNAAVIGQSLPGSWRPFSDDSLWNTPIKADALTHPDSEKIIAFATAEAKNIRLARVYSIPVWVVNSNNIPLLKVRSDKIFDTWDTDSDGWSDEGIPVLNTMWAEPTEDGHICIIDFFKGISWELSRFGWTDDSTPKSTTFNIWRLGGTGAGDYKEGERWQVRGGRGSGFPLIAGLIRPEELKSGEIRHALVFTFPKNRQADNGKNIFLPPASRSDGRHAGRQYPIEGMRFQLDPSITEKDLDKWGLTREGKIVARALQKYGMFLGDNGGAMALQAQLLAQSSDGNRKKWEELSPGFYKNVEKIPTNKFRVVYTGEPVVK